MTLRGEVSTDGDGHRQQSLLDLEGAVPWPDPSAGGRIDPVRLECAMPATVEVGERDGLEPGEPLNEVRPVAVDQQHRRRDDDRGRQRQVAGQRRWHELPFGAVICFVTVEGAYQVGAWTPPSRRVPVIRAMPGSAPLPETGLELCRNERRFLDIDEGTWLWQLGSVELLPTPIPAVGQQGVWRWQGAANAT